MKLISLLVEKYNTQRAVCILDSSIPCAGHRPAGVKGREQQLLGQRPGHPPFAMEEPKRMPACWLWASTAIAGVHLAWLLPLYRGTHGTCHHGVPPERSGCARGVHGTYGEAMVKSGDPSEVLAEAASCGRPGPGRRWAAAMTFWQRKSVPFYFYTHLDPGIFPWSCERVEGLRLISSVYVSSANSEEQAAAPADGPTTARAAISSCRPSGTRPRKANSRYAGDEWTQ